MKQQIIFLLLLVLINGAKASINIREIRTASDNVLVVLLHNDNEVDVSGLDMSSSKWKINDATPSGIGLYAMEADSCDYHVYLETETLENGVDYLISTPYGDTAIQFDDRKIFCESIKTNQAAYSSLANNNYALFAIWLGDKGSRQIDGSLPEYEVFEQYTDETVVSGTLTEIGENPSSGDYVYRIDLSSVPQGGPYIISVKGYGCSWPFGVGSTFSKRLAYIMFRSQYYQRCGCPIVEPYGWNIRDKPCHTTVYDVDGDIGEARIRVNGSEPSFVCIGGYHDAGDADRRAYHMANPIINLMIYEAFPDLFYDEQFNIPDQFDSLGNIIGKGNGIPDIIDEAVWGTLVWEYLQNDDGSIHFGTETYGYPDPFAAPLDQDDKLYGTVKIDDRAAATGAGLFMHLARIVEPFDSEYSGKLYNRAQKSFNFIKDRMADPEKLYYYVQKYLYDGDANAHEQLKNLRNSVDNMNENVWGCYGYSLNDRAFDNPGYFLSYILETEKETDPDMVAYFISELKEAADANLAELSKYAYPVGNDPDNDNRWGHNVMQPIYACAPVLYWKLTGEQKYIDGACELMNYILGLNPLGISYVTGLGFHQVHNPQDRESEYTKSLGWGPKPGITVFGPGVLGFGAGAQTHPGINSLPSERMFGDDINSISTAEFTIFETMSHNSIFTVLSNGGTWDENDDPFSRQQTSVKKRSKNANNRNVPSFSVYLRENTLNLSFKLEKPSETGITVYSLIGKKIMSIDLGKRDAGVHKIELPLNGSAMRLVSKGVNIVKLRTGKQLQVSSIMVY